jgi:hypothetical protein
VDRYSSKLISMLAFMTRMNLQEPAA